MKAGTKSEAVTYSEQLVCWCPLFILQCMPSLSSALYERGREESPLRVAWKSVGKLPLVSFRSELSIFFKGLLLPLRSTEVLSLASFGENEWPG